MEIVFNSETLTIRQMPENYLLAYLSNGRWVVDPDTACELRLAKAVTEAIGSYKGKHAEGEALAQIAGRLANESAPLTEEQIICFGRNVAHLLYAKRCENYPDRWQLRDFGDKTSLGLGKVILRLLDDVKG